MDKPLRRLLLILVGTLVALLAVRTGFSVWERHQVPPGYHESLAQLFWIGLLAEATILVTAGLGAWWLVRRARQQDRERIRMEHLAQVGLLSGGLAHEIRNYLSAMNTHIGLLRKALALNSDPPEDVNPDSQRTRRQIDRLERTVMGLEELLTDYLTFARPNKDHPEEVDAGGLLCEVVEFLILDLERAGVQVNLELAPDLPPIYVDRAKMKRAVLNLMINARQAMPEGGKLSVRSQSSRGVVVLEIEDSGVGIPEEEQSRVFDTFFSTKSEGTGLGLAVVKRTIEDFGGQIHLQSQEGVGSCFRLVMPAVVHKRGGLARPAPVQPRAENATIGSDVHKLDTMDMRNQSG